ncbi:MAG TPA: glycosyltransferase [Alphaproteobacteria bacterium]|nr:glycosyltransferase [Alphaproteobacteria bacterium]
MPPDRPTFRAAFYTGNFHLRDGIGRSIRDKVNALRSGADGRDWQVTVFCQDSNIDDPAVTICGSLAQVVCSPAFQEADLHLFEFGWYYQLMDAVLFVPPHARALAHFQGITAPEFLKDRSGYLASWKQQFNLHKTDTVMCSSHYTRQVLERFGIDKDRLRLLLLPVSVLPRAPPVKAVAGPVNLLQVGRLIQSKGTLDLVRALAMLPPETRDEVKLKIVGSRPAGDQDYLAEIDAAIAGHGLNDSVVFVGTVTDDNDLSDLYAAADALIAPSYHEGYCLPVVEAYAHGCHVIAYDNSNLPYVTAGLGRIVPTGDVAALSEAIAAFVQGLANRADNSATVLTESGGMPWSELQEKVRAHAETLKHATFDRTFLGLVGEALAAPSPSGIDRLDPALFFEDRRSFTIRPRELQPKDEYSQPGLAIWQGDRIEYDSARFPSVEETLLFFGPYIELSPGRWRLRLDADIDGEFTLRLTCNFGVPVAEAVVSNTERAIEFTLPEPIEKFETLLFAAPDARSIVLRGIAMDRLT